MAYLLIFGMISSATSREWLSPATSYEILNQTPPPSSCRDGNEEEKVDAEITNYGKSATFSLNGLYRCERSLFDYGDRNSFINLVANTAPGQADVAARKINAIISNNVKSTTTKSVRLVIDVNSESEFVIPLVVAAYQTAFAQRLRTIQILRRDDLNDPNLYRVRVNVHRIDDPNNILKTTLTWHHNGKTNEVSI
jgi:hypothetical protein